MRFEIQYIDEEYEEEIVLHLVGLDNDWYIELWRPKDKLLSFKIGDVVDIMFSSVIKKEEG